MKNVGYFVKYCTWITFRVLSVVLATRTRSMWLGLWNCQIPKKSLNLRQKVFCLWFQLWGTIIIDHLFHLYPEKVPNFHKPTHAVQSRTAMAMPSRQPISIDGVNLYVFWALIGNHKKMWLQPKFWRWFWKLMISSPHSTIDIFFLFIKSNIGWKQFCSLGRQAICSFAEMVVFYVLMILWSPSSRTAMKMPSLQPSLWNVYTYLPKKKCHRDSHGGIH